MQDLSSLADNSLTATSQGAGNMMSSNETAMTAPGSQPVTPLPPTRDQDTPNMEMTPRIPVSYTGKPDVTKQAGPVPRTRPAWGKTETPDVVRTPAPRPPEPTGDAGLASIGVAGPARGATSGRAASARASTSNGG
jgi:hypothetical protein